MPKEINNFRQFNEANIRTNKGLDSDYIDNIRDREMSDAHRKIQNREVSPPHQIMQLVSQLMEIQGGELSHTPMGLMPIWHDQDKKREIEELAREIINDRYGRLIDSMKIEMDIALIDSSELQNMKQSNDMVDSPPSSPPESKESDDENLKDDVDKRKIANIITQGSAKNVHRLIHLYKDKIEEYDPQLFDLMDRLIKSNEVAEWMIPDNPNNGKMIREMMNGFTITDFGSEEEKEEFGEILDDIDIEQLISDENFDTGDTFDDWDGEIKVTARGLDLVILLHESVKGIFEALSAASIPKHDVQRAKNILMNTDTLQDEFEDLRYGPAIREDLLNWVNDNNKVNQIEDGFELVWGAMVSIPSKPFLELFFDAIIGKTGIADKWLDDLLDKLIKEEIELKKVQYEHEQEVANWEEFQKNNSNTKDESEDESEESQEVDYSKMSQRELAILRDDALDNRDFDTLGEITKYLK